MRRLITVHLALLLLLPVAGGAFAGDGNLVSTTVKRQISEMDCGELKKLRMTLGHDYRTTESQLEGDEEDVRDLRRTIRQKNAEKIGLTNQLKKATDKKEKRRLRKELRKITKKLKSASGELNSIERSIEKNDNYLAELTSDIARTEKYLKLRKCKRG